MVSANFANFGGVDRQKLAKLAPTDKVSWGSGTGWPAVSITSKKRRAPKAELDSISRRGPVGKLRNSYEPKGCDGKRRISQEAGALPRFKRGGE